MTSYLAKYNLKEDTLISFRQPVYAKGNSGLIYAVGQEIKASEVTEQALGFAGAWYRVDSEAVEEVTVASPKRGRPAKVEEPAVEK